MLLMIESDSKQIGEQVKDESEIDDEVVRSLQSLGMGDFEEVKAALMAPPSNIQQVYYKLLLDRKRNPDTNFYLNQLRARQIRSRERGSSAPLMNDVLAFRDRRSSISGPTSPPSPPATSPGGSPVSSPTSSPTSPRKKFLNSHRAFTRRNR